MVLPPPVGKAVAQLNTRLARPIEPFKLARRHDMIQRLIYDPEVTREIVAYAEQNGVPENVAFEKAKDYAREIVPSFSAFAYFSFGIRVAKLLANSVYRIETADSNDATLASIPKDATVVFIMNHRSNMDYMLVTYLAARSSALSYAVGEWARVWPLSRLIKSMGAYFIRRRSRGALYRKVLARYVQLAIAGGVTQAIYPEGGLSLDGRLQPPKMGLLAYVVEGFDPAGSRDVVFVPVAINYDRVLEDRVLIAAGERGDRRFGARITVIVKFIIKKLWERLRGKDTRFGVAAVAFGSPVSLKSEANADVETLSKRLMTRIEDVMPVPMVPIIAHVMLQGEILDTDGITAAARDLLTRVPSENRVVKPATLHEEVRIAVSQMSGRGLIFSHEGHWRIAEGQSRVLRFYANSIAHFLRENAAEAIEISATARS